ncbi:gamma-butyrobetaine hydroxylase-like domain-containing protein [Bermanella sp. R86510]|uniref:gamma-butyrobetaine hydroxylase-like domain-containing protein n=1 Tax=unclassified Bermanella TaxID=2627862 RepID=UPI0037C67FE2
MMAKIPSKIDFHTQSQQLELGWGDSSYQLSAEFLRVYSPSAEVRGHGQGNEVLQHGKQDVRILKLEPVGNYALKIYFDDGHDSGLYNWDYLKDLAENQDHYWQDYLARLEQAGKTRAGQQIMFKPVD